jgi:hypothetical protein
MADHVALSLKSMLLLVCYEERKPSMQKLFKTSFVAAFLLVLLCSFGLTGGASAHSTTEHPTASSSAHLLHHQIASRSTSVKVIPFGAYPENCQPNYNATYRILSGNTGVQSCFGSQGSGSIWTGVSNPTRICTGMYKNTYIDLYWSGGVDQYFLPGGCYSFSGYSYSGTLYF